MGRPTKLTPKLSKRICARIEAGNYPEVAAQAEGVGRSTFYEWTAKGREGKQPYADFADEVARAYAAVEADMVAELRSALDDKGNTDTRSRQWLLERTRRDRYGQRIEVVAKEQAARDLIERLREGLDPATFGRVLEVLVGEDGEEVPAGDELH